MTVTIDISHEAEEHLRRGASVAGVSFTEFVADVVEEAARAYTTTAPSLPADAIDHPDQFDNLAFLREIGVLGSVTGTPRTDGRSWSEIEAACDAH